MAATPQIILIHTRADDQEAEKIYQKLSEAGCKAWIAKRNIPLGKNRPEYTNKAIEESQIFLVLLSAKSFEENRSLKKDIQELISKSKQVAQNNGCILLPVRLDSCEIPELLEDIQELDLFTSDGWTLLLTTIQEIENELKSTQKPDRFPSEAEKGNERSYTRIEHLNNQQGVVFTGGTANLNLDQRRNKIINNQTRNTEPTPISQPTQSSLDNLSELGKLVILKLGNGEFETGFNVTLQIATENGKRLAEIQCILPASPNLLSNYERWQSIYRDGYSRIGSQTRLEAPSAQKTNFSFAEFVRQCHESGDSFRNSLNTWLNSEQFRSCKEVCLRKINSSDNIRLIIQTEDSRLRRLPWHLWNFFDDYRKAEIALSSLEFDRADKNVSATPRTKVRILAILGDRTGINIEKDQAILQNLPDAECVFLPEPNRREVDNCLWDERGWDILFFAGHSSSHSNAETGKIYLNKNDSLTMGELRYALRRAIESGLQLAIFNSCDGLGIARELAGLHIPQIIAMREPVADLVAQEFLKHFLTAFSSNKPLYLAVREARERLQSLEDRFPCATWLPVICQNPAEVPPVWQELCGRK